MKRFFDFIASLIGLILMTIPFVVISILIKLRMPGPIFFVQSRIGKRGRPFRLYKFRTMSVDVSKSKGSFDVGDTSRITPLGRVLRKTKLDELPQLINVLVGDMSLVGPRPEVEKWTTIYPEMWTIVHSVRPGITDNASIMFRNEEEILARSVDAKKTYEQEILPLKLDLYVDYVRNQSFFGDIKIILETIKIIVIK